MSASESSFIKGQRGEEQACAFLVNKGYQILHRNLRSGGPEVDIIARVGETICFVEVKSWQTVPIQDLHMAFAYRKRCRLIRSARLYLAKHPELAMARIRFDCILISGIRSTVEHFEAVFDASDMEH
jgi:putative endonuclease